jgi:hypothetical protein
MDITFIQNFNEFYGIHNFNFNRRPFDEHRDHSRQTAVLPFTAMGTCQQLVTRLHAQRVIIDIFHNLRILLRKLRPAVTASGSLIGLHSVIATGMTRPCSSHRAERARSPSG